MWLLTSSTILRKGYSQNFLTVLFCLLVSFNGRFCIAAAAW